MSNWFENHPIRSIVTYTIVIATTTWIAFAYVFDESRVKLAQAGIEGERQRVAQFEAKAGILEAQIRQLRDENQKYLLWLSQTPNTIPYLDASLQKLSIDNSLLREDILTLKKIATPSSQPVVIKKRYSYSKSLKKGESFIDEQTGVILGFVDVDQRFKAEILLNIPGKTQETLRDVSAGSSWEFSKGDKKYRVLLSIVDWYSNSATAAVNEIY